MPRGFAYAAPAPCTKPQEPVNQDKERKDSQARGRAFKRALRARKQADYWRQRWASHPETMRSNLDRINGTRREKAAERTERLLQILSHCPKAIPSWELRKTFDNAVTLAGFTLTPTSSTVLLSALRRRNLIRFDHASLSWLVVSEK